MRNNFRNIAFFILGAFLFISCEKDKNGSGTEERPPLATEGQLVFSFYKRTVYEITELSQMSKVQFVLRSEAGKDIVLPIQTLTEAEDTIYTSKVNVPAGRYKVKEYVAFDNKGGIVAEKYYNKDNEIVVKQAEVTTFFNPIDIKEMVSSNNLKNVLLGMCKKIFGDNPEIWPWKDSDKLADWKGLEFEEDDYGNILYLSAITFDSRFAPMTKLPDGLASIPSLIGVVLLDLPNMEALSDDIGELTISSLTILNTKLKSLPENLFDLDLNAISIINSEITEVPASINRFQNLLHFQVSDSPITSLPTTIGDLYKLRSFIITGTQIEELPDVFASWKYMTLFDLKNNTKLSSLPNSIAQMPEKVGGGYFLDGCGFTSIPTNLGQRTKILRLKNNKITEIPTDIATIYPNLESLILDGNKIGGIPVLGGKMMELSLNDCGLNVLPGISNLSDLRSFSFDKNNITTVSNDYFKDNTKIAIISFSDIDGLQSLPDANNFGFKTIQVTDEGGNLKNVFEYINLIQVNNCPNLNWEIPSNWFIRTDAIGLVEGPGVIVEKQNSPGVTQGSSIAP